jgi:hypothetical protein
MNNTQNETQVPVAVTEKSTIESLKAKIAELEANAIGKANEVGEKEWSISLGQVAGIVYLLSVLFAALALFNIVSFGLIFSLPTFLVLILGALYTWLTSSSHQ